MENEILVLREPIRSFTVRQGSERGTETVWLTSVKQIRKSRLGVQNLHSTSGIFCGWDLTFVRDASLPTPVQMLRYCDVVTLDTRPKVSCRW
jgi:hypothetical protein